MQRRRAGVGITGLPAIAFARGALRTARSQWPTKEASAGPSSGDSYATKGLASSAPGRAIPMAKSRSARRPARRYSFACVSDHTDEVDDTNAFATCGLDVRGDRFGDEGRRRLTGRRERFARAYKDAYLSSKTSRRATRVCGRRAAGRVWRGAGAGGRGQFGTPSGRAALASTGPAPRVGPRREGKWHMPAGITSSDSMFSVRETPWHGLGACSTGRRRRSPKRSKLWTWLAGGAGADRGRPG